MERITKPGIRARIAVGAAAAAVAATVWGAATIAAPAHGHDGGHGGGHDQENVSRQRDPAEGAPAAGAPADPRGGGAPEGVPGAVPDTLTHASEAGANAVNITIDDGPDPTWTPKVLEVLRKHGVKATFCMIGPQAKAHPDLVKQVVADGHRLCDHTMDHDTGMDKKPVEYQKQQIMAAKKLIEAAAGGGAQVDYYRAPGGAFTPESRALAAAAGMRPLGWNVDTKDFRKPGTAAIVNAVKQELRRGPTVLFHDGGGNREQTVEALDQVLSWLREQGRPTGFPARTAP
ncbi:polysaccharide deacetylase family protein [Streptomyces sp. NPDC002138]|uniref:polysaccharide deacetylase family protein n=1 Tax=Streptomyces sp. NPDC002138 TaxID=3154410 RepID=UPI00332EBFC7